MLRDWEAGPGSRLSQSDVDHLMASSRRHGTVRAVWACLVELPTRSQASIHMCRKDHAQHCRPHSDLLYIVATQSELKKVLGLGSQLRCWFAYASRAWHPYLKGALQTVLPNCIACIREKKKRFNPRNVSGTRLGPFRPLRIAVRQLTVTI